MKWLGSLFAPGKAHGEVVGSIGRELNDGDDSKREQGAASWPIPGAVGHTLMEIVVVLALVAILAGSAYPSYHRSVLEGRRIDATSRRSGCAIQRRHVRGSLPS